MRKTLWAMVLTTLTWNVSALHAVQIRASPFKAGDVYSVESEETLNGHIDFKPPGKNDVKRFAWNGERKTRYIERVLDAKNSDDGVPERVLRRVEALTSKRTIGDEKQVGFDLRDDGKHVVLHRGEAFAKPFSLKGPLKQEEIHTLSHQVFVPALNGILPQGALAKGAKWTANRRAVAQLAGMVPLESGDLSCTVEDLDFNFKGRRLVQIKFAGVLEGISEEGRASDDVNGTLYLDRETGKVHSLTVKGQRTLFDEKHKVAGRLNMRYTLAVRMKEADADLNDATAAEAAKDPTTEQTAMLWEYPPFGIRIVHPRAWMLQNVKGTGAAFEFAKQGNQMIIDFPEDDQTPSAKDYQTKIGEILKAEEFQNVKWTTEPIEVNRDNRRLGTFEATATKDGDWRMRYWVYQHGKRGVTVGVFMHSKAAQDGVLGLELKDVLTKHVTFTNERNPYFVKPPADADKKK